ncbi:recombinase RecT [Bordetella trematum]|uniref:recombinase RecT n=1 Tax=Bordetella trematum TaxID=123899 RepID=UPI00046F1A54|nr:recombinase RecT [Bordetella trematum]
MSNEITAVEELVYSVRPAFESVQTDHGIAFEREAEFAIQAIMGSDFAIKIALQNRQSVIDAVTNVAAIGISLNPAKKQAYLVPRKGGICLSIGYMGLLDLAMDSGSIRWGQARLVYSTDTFRLNGLDRQPVHEFDPFSKERGEIVGVYVSVKTADGDYLTEAMSTDEVNAIRDRSDAWQAYLSKKRSCPWVTDWGEMAKKTAVHRAYKYWPKTDRLENAIHHLVTDAGEGIRTQPSDVVDIETVEAWATRIAACLSTDALTQAWKDWTNERKAIGANAKTDEAIKSGFAKAGSALRKAEANTVEESGA